jgi:hypothetical protein
MTTASKASDEEADEDVLASTGERCVGGELGAKKWRRKSAG